MLVSSNGVNRNHVKEKLKCNSDHEFLEKVFSDTDKESSLLASQYKRRVKAKQLSESKQRDSGEIDTDALWKYKLDNDIFKQHTIMPNGKSNGIMVLLDWSGSMHAAVLPMLKQAVTLCKFARKSGIHCQVMAFRYVGAGGYAGVNQDFMRMSNFRLIEFFNSSMTNKELFQVSQLLYAANYSNWETLQGGYDICRMLMKYRLGSTPLAQGLSTVAMYMQKHYIGNYDNNNLIVISDGAADHAYPAGLNKKYVNPYNNAMYQYTEQSVAIEFDASVVLSASFHGDQKFIMYKEKGAFVTECMLKEIRKMGVHTSCFFIELGNVTSIALSLAIAFFHKPHSRTFYTQAIKQLFANLDLNEKQSKLFIDAKPANGDFFGYQDFFILRNKLFDIAPVDGSLDDDELDLSESTVASAAKAFDNSIQSSQNNRMMTQRIIDILV